MLQRFYVIAVLYVKTFGIAAIFAILAATDKNRVAIGFSCAGAYFVFGLVLDRLTRKLVLPDFPKQDAKHQLNTFAQSSD